MAESVGPLFYEIELIESFGMFGKAGSPVLMCRAAGIFPIASFVQNANIVVLSRDERQERWHEYKQSIDEKQSAAIFEHLKALGLPDRLPDVEGVHLTAHFWVGVSIGFKFDDRRFYLNLWAAEGIRGTDAEKVRELFRYLFRLAGFPGSSALTGDYYADPGYYRNDAGNQESSTDEVLYETAQIPLELKVPTLYLARIEDDRLLDEAEFYLAIKAEVPEKRLIDFFVHGIVKISAPEVIDTVIGSALPGVLLTHSTSPPDAIPKKPGLLYFRLDTQGVYWQGIRNSKSLIVRIPEYNPEQLELYAQIKRT